MTAEQNIPIDIHTNKLVDWLISRRHCDRGWVEKVITIREKINHAIQDMPEHPEITKLLSGAYINYFHCVKIVDILRETEADTKNLFGRYGSQRMKDWQEVIRLYQQGNVYLAEAAQMLTRNVTYEVPALKKQIAKCDQVQNECDKKETDFGKRMAETRTRYNASCRQLGIPGVKVKNELISCLQELPAIFRTIAEDTRKVKDACQLYKDFLKYSITEGNVNDDTTPLLHYIIDHGNTTTYEWRYGEPPVRVEEPSLHIDLGDEGEEEAAAGDGGAATEEIDFGSIDFGADNVDTLETGDIDWGIATTEDAHSPSNDQAIDLDLDISLEDTGIVIEESGLEGGVARDSEALTLLDNPKTRSLFTDELMELEAFLAQRLVEMMDDSESIYHLMHQSSSPSSLQVQQSTVSSMLETVRKVLRQLTDVRLQHLCLIKLSPRYVDRLAESVKHHLRLCEKLEQARETARTRRQEVLEQQRLLQPRLKTIIEKTRELQGQIEGDISKRYKNRPVNIMGEINTL